MQLCLSQVFIKNFFVPFAKEPLVQVRSEDGIKRPALSSCVVEPEAAHLSALLHMHRKRHGVEKLSSLFLLFNRLEPYLQMWFISSAPLLDTRRPHFRCFE